MKLRISRVVLAAVCLMGLAGCETTSTNNPLAKASDADVTGSVLSPEAKSDTTPDAPPLKPERHYVNWTGCKRISMPIRPRLNGPRSACSR